MYVGVAGNYATGKTTLVSQLSEILGWISLTESPENEAKIVNQFYENPKRWAFANQIDFLDSYLQRTFRALQHQRDGVIQERVLLELMYVFNRTLRDRGYLSEPEYDILRSVFNTIEQNIDIFPDVLVYVHCDIDLILERIERRGREHENMIDSEYIEELNEAYDIWIQSVDHCPVVKINSSTYDFRQTDDSKDIARRIKSTYENTAARDIG